MEMAIDKKKMAERAKRVGAKQKYTYALTPSIVEAFKKECDALGSDYGPMIEELMKEFLGMEDSTKRVK